MDTLEIGSAPYEEDTAQVGSIDYAARAKRQCAAYRAQLARMFGDPPEGCRLVIKGNPHDYGTYYEVAARFDENIEAAVNYAFRCENEAPSRWDAVALATPGAVTAPDFTLEGGIT